MEEEEAQSNAGCRKKIMEIARKSPSKGTNKNSSSQYLLVKSEMNRMLLKSSDRHCDITVETVFGSRPSILSLRPGLNDSDHFVYFYDKPDTDQCKGPYSNFEEILHSVTDDMQNMMKTQSACKVKELANAISSKSTLVYFPEDVKLTDKHLAEMPPKPANPEDIFWPNRWQFDENMGSFLCVVDRIDKNNYEFKVLMIPGSYTDDPVTLAMLMKLFNPLYQVTSDSREAALKKAKMMVATAANEFFGPQIVESCIAVWLSTRSDHQFKLKKSNMILKMDNPWLRRSRPTMKTRTSHVGQTSIGYEEAGPSHPYTSTIRPLYSPRPSTSAEWPSSGTHPSTSESNPSTSGSLSYITEVSPSASEPRPSTSGYRPSSSGSRASTIEPQPSSSASSPPSSSTTVATRGVRCTSGPRRKYRLATTTQSAHYLTAIFGYNRAMYPDIRTLNPRQCMYPIYAFIREIHVNEAQLSLLVAGLSPSKYIIAERSKG